MRRELAGERRNRRLQTSQGHRNIHRDPEPELPGRRHWLDHAGRDHAYRLIFQRRLVAGAWPLGLAPSMRRVRTTTRPEEVARTDGPRSTRVRAPAGRKRSRGDYARVLPSSRSSRGASHALQRADEACRSVAQPSCRELGSPKAVQPYSHPVSTGAVSPNLAVLGVLTGYVTPPKENPGDNKRRHRIENRDPERVPDQAPVGRAHEGAVPGM